MSDLTNRFIDIVYKHDLSKEASRSCLTETQPNPNAPVGYLRQGRWCFSMIFAYRTVVIAFTTSSFAPLVAKAAVMGSVNDAPGAVGVVGVTSA